MRLRETLSGRFSERGDGSKFPVVIIRSGLSKNGVLYTPEVLEKSVPLFEGAKAYVFRQVSGDADHLSDELRKNVPQGFVANIAGWYENVRMCEDEGVPAIIADLHISKNMQDIRELLTDAFDNDKQDVIGLSIDAEGMFSTGVHEGKKVRVVDSIELVNSVDLVTHPAAGGRFMKMVASMKDIEKAEAAVPGAILKMIRESVPTWAEGFSVDEIPETCDEAMTLLSDILESTYDRARSLLENEDVVDDAKRHAEVAHGGRALKQMLVLIEKIMGGEMDALAELKDLVEKTIASLPDSEERSSPGGDVAVSDEESDVDNGGGVKEKTKKTPEEIAAEKKAATESLKESEDKTKKQLKEAEAANKRGQDAADKLEARERNLALRESLSECDLPKLAKDRIIESFKSKTDWKDEDVTAAIESEKKYLGELVESSSVSGFGAVSDVKVTKDELKKKQERLDKTFDQNDADGYHSFLEAMADISGYVHPDRPTAIRQLLHCVSLSMPGHADADFEEHHDMIRESRVLRTKVQYGRFREAIDTSVFAQLLGDSMTRRLRAKYNSPDNSEWRKVVSHIKNLQDFRTQRTVTVGGFGDLATVTQGAPYLEFANPTDFEMTYAATKRGGLVVVTFETMLQDDLGEIRRIPDKLGDAAGRTLTKFVLDTLIFANPLVDEDGVATVNAAHNNITAAALSYDEVVTSRQRMKKQTDPSSLERVAIKPKYLLGVVDLEDTIDEILNGKIKIVTNDDATTPSTIKNLTKIISPHQTSTTQWRVVADPAQNETIEMGFLGGRQNPEMFVLDQQVGSVFASDEVQWKIRHIYGGDVVDFRSFDGRIT